MKRLILAILVGILAGYAMGYRDGYDGEPSWKARIVAKFGGRKAEELRAEQEAREAELDRVGRP